ncbi:30S ribosomal protein S8 [Candidatus Parcubacteria bacterium]|nr:30S ribosomal protein S8 [Candidatus Parcubacteria bacterium]
MTDPIADMLNRIINAQVVSKPVVLMPFSKFKYELALLLEKENLVGKVEKMGKKVKKQIKIDLKYDDKIPCIEGLCKVSKPGQRIYSSFKDIRKVRGGYGISIISTPKGLLTDREARRQKIGGEIICKIW